MDQRDSPTWVTLELSKPGEVLAIRGSLADRLRRELGVFSEFPVFVPYSRYTKGGRTVSIRLIEGYAFVAAGLPEVAYFSLEKTPLVERVFSVKPKNGLRVLQTIPDQKIQEMAEKLRNLVSSEVSVGDEVRITGGTYARLEGTVVDVYETTVTVRIVLRSLQILAVVPKSLVETLREPDPSVVVTEEPDLTDL